MRTFAMAVAVVAMFGCEDEDETSDPAVAEEAAGEVVEAIEAPPTEAPSSFEADLANVMSSHRRALQVCYEQASRTEEPAVVQFEIRIIVAESGSVTADIQGDDYGEMKRCLEDEVTSWQFPAGVGTRSTQFPLVYRPGSPQVGNPLMYCATEANYNACVIRNLRRPSSPREFDALINAYRETGQRGRACVLMRQVIQRYPSSPAARRYIQYVQRQCSEP